MAYERLNLKNGDTLTEEHMAHIEDAIVAAIRAVPTAERMDAILANATPENVGTFYMYIGPTTDKYESGAIYELKTDGV